MDSVVKEMKQGPQLPDRRVFFFWIISLFWGLGGTLTAASVSVLQWSTPEQQFKARAGDEKIVTTYPFKNAGPRPVRIIALATSCACTTAELKKEVYAPGEQGALNVEFEIGPQTGRVDRTVTVTTDEATTEPTVLRIVVDIAELVAVRPKFLFWKANEPGDEKAVVVTFADPVHGKLGELHLPNADFSARVERDENSGQYQLWVKPTSTAKPIQSVIHLDATTEGRPQSLAIFAAVKS